MDARQKNAIVSSLLHFSRDLTRKHRKRLFEVSEKRLRPRWARAQRVSELPARPAAAASVDVGTLTDRPESCEYSVFITPCDSALEKPPLGLLSSVTSGGSFDEEMCYVRSQHFSSFYQIPCLSRPAAWRSKPAKLAGIKTRMQPDGALRAVRSYSRVKVRTRSKTTENRGPVVVGSAISPLRNGLRKMECEESGDDDCTAANPKLRTQTSMRQASLSTLLKITNLQAQLAQIRINLAHKERKIDAYRRKAKEELIVGKRAGPAHMSPNAVSDIVSFITLLEEQNRDLRALSAIPVEIDKLRADLSLATNRKKSYDAGYRSFPTDDDLAADWDAATQLRAEVAELKKKLEAETLERERLERIVIPLQQAKSELELEIARLHADACKDISLVSFQDNEQFRGEDNARCLTSASPLGKKRKEDAHSLRTSPKSEGKVKGPVLKKRGYSPTFLRVQKARKLPKAKSQRTTPEPLQQRACSPA